MMKLLVILFIMKLIAQINIFKYVRQKHGESAVKIVRTLEQVKRRYAKVNEDIKFIKICKKKRIYSQSLLKSDSQSEVAV